MNEASRGSTSVEVERLYSLTPRIQVQPLFLNEAGIFKQIRQQHPFTQAPDLTRTLLYKESLEQAAIRIAQTEAGMKISTGILVGISEKQLPDELNWVVNLGLSCQSSQPIDPTLLETAQLLPLSDFKSDFMPSQNYKRRQPFTEEQFANVFSRISRLSVDLYLKTEQGIVLSLRQHHTWQNQWHPLGGTLYLGEPLTQAAIRIAQEEGNLDVNVHRALGYMQINEEHERGFGSSVCIVMLCTPTPESLNKIESNSNLGIFTKQPAQMISEYHEIFSRF